MNGGVGPLAQVTCVRRESFAISGPDGDLMSGGTDGFYVRDTRFLDQFRVRLVGRELRALDGGLAGADRAIFHSYVPRDADHEVDATLIITRRRIVDGGLYEELQLRNAAMDVEALELELWLGTDFAYIFDVKHGHELDHAHATPDGHRLTFVRPDGDERTRVSLLVDGAPPEPRIRQEAGATVASLVLSVPARATRVVSVAVTVSDVYGEAAPGRDTRDFDHTEPPPVPALSLPLIDASDPVLRRLLRRSLHDLEGLVLHDPSAPEDRFAAAGSPWFLTLFGRDSLWAALMALPFDPDLAAGTLRALARRQGRHVDPDTEEAPGKILHEVRRGALAERGDLPPYYYGSVDATPLFVILAHEAWRWGVDEEEIAELLPHVEAALGWMKAYGDPDDDGFLEYVRHGARGLANQGWKDSGDGIRFADGTIAQAPLALAEVQGYAYAAACGGARLLDRFGRPGGDDWRRWAQDLADQFRERFWVEDAAGPYPAVALDHDKRRVDAVASNMGHLLFTGILSDDEAGHVARRLTSVEMDSGFGLRTLSTDSRGYNPLSYHCGTVWPHDTAIAAWGLAHAGHDDAAARLVEGLVRAAPSFGHRLPELYAGLGRSETPHPVPYPAACRPQAWSAGGALLIVRTLLGLDADVPGGTLLTRPLDRAVVDRLELRGLRLAAGSLDVLLQGGVVRVELHGPAIRHIASS